MNKGDKLILTGGVFLEGTGFALRFLVHQTHAEVIKVIPGPFEKCMVFVRLSQKQIAWFWEDTPDLWIRKVDTDDDTAASIAAHIHDMNLAVVKAFAKAGKKFPDWLDELYVASVQADGQYWHVTIGVSNMAFVHYWTDGRDD